MLLFALLFMISSTGHGELRTLCSYIHICIGRSDKIFCYILAYTLHIFHVNKHGKYEGRVDFKNLVESRYEDMRCMNYDEFDVEILTVDGDEWYCISNNSLGCTTYHHPSCI